MFLKEKIDNFQMDNKMFNKLFASQAEFKKQYGISTEQLMSKYGYEKFLKEKNNETVI